MKVDVIIPAYKPDKTFFKLIDMLEKQTHPVQKIIIMNTEEKYFEKLIYGNRSLENYYNIKVYHLSKNKVTLLLHFCFHTTPLYELHQCIV